MNIFKDYDEQYPNLAGLKKDEELKEQANLAVVEYLTEHKTAGGQLIQYLGKSISKNVEAVQEQLATDWEQSTRSMEDFGDVIDDNIIKINAIATLMSLRDLYVIEGELRDVR